MNKRGMSGLVDSSGNPISSAKKSVKKMATSLKILIAIIGIIGVIVLGWFSWHLAIKPLLEIVPSWGEEITTQAVNAPQWLVSLIGKSAFESWNALIVFGAVVFILLFAMADIINTFSTFEQTTSWVIAGGLAIIGVMTGVINKIIVYLFGGVATFGALGIGLIVIWALVLAVLTNFFIGWSGIKAMKNEVTIKNEIADAAETMRKGFGKLKGAAEMDKG